MVQLKGEKVMVVPSTADGFQTAVSALRSLDGKDGVRFHTFTLPKECCVRLLVKNLGRGMPQSVGREELESQIIRIHGSLNCVPAVATKTPQGPRSHPHFIISVARGSEVSKVRLLTEICGLQMSVGSYVFPKCSMQCKCCHRFDHTQRKYG